MIVHLGVFDGRRLNATDHTIDRYIERVKPALTFDQAVVELGRLLQFATPGPCPVWLKGHPDKPTIGGNVTSWLHLTDEIALAIEYHPDHPPKAVTCIAAGGRSDASRDRSAKWRHNKALERNPRKMRLRRKDRPRPRFDDEGAA